MPKVLADYQSKVAALIQDKAGDLEVTDRDDAIQSAVEKFSQLRAREVVADVTGTGAADYTPPTGWIEKFSKIKKIEYPLNNVPATYLEDADYEVYQTPSAEKIRLRTVRPTASESFRVTFNGLHTVDATTGTIGDADFFAVCNLAGAIACQMLANRYSQSTEPTLGADSVDHKSKAFEYSQRSKELMTAFRQHIGADSSTPSPAATVIKDWDRNFPWGEDRLTHPRRWR